MAHILIDGYNLIGTAHRNLEKARIEIIRNLGVYARLKSHNITVIFDGWKDGHARTTKQRIGGVTVIYSGLGEKADDVMKDILSKTAGRWIAVSSDREIYDFAQKRNCAALRTDEFEKKLTAALEGHEAIFREEPDEDDEDAGPFPRKKGNPRKLSKKDKRKAEALKKL